MIFLLLELHLVQQIIPIRKIDFQKKKKEKIFINF